jgi:hypothetical protein
MYLRSHRHKDFTARLFPSSRVQMKIYWSTYYNKKEKERKEKEKKREKG